MNCCQKKQKLKRKIYFNVLPNLRDQTDKGNFKTEKFTSNYIQTSKFTIWSFLPMVLFNEISKLSNIYFVAMCILNCIPVIQIYSVTSSVLPIVLILSVSIIKQLIENIVCWVKDYTENNKKCTIFNENSIDQISYKNLNVGDIVVLPENSYSPADCVILASSMDTGHVFVETASLDGEKALKPRHSIKETLCCCKFNENENPFVELNSSFSFEAEIPSENLYTFEGYFYFYDQGIKNNNRVKATLKNFLYKGCHTKIAQNCLGLVIYTGKETKIQLNLNTPRSKVSRLEKLVNEKVIIIAVIQILLSLVSMIYRTFKLSSQFETVVFGSYDTAYILTFLQYVILLQNFIPISLFLSLEILRFLQGIFMRMSEELISKPKGKPKIKCKVNTFSLCDELGRIEYMLTDKTGTLTKNKLNMVGLFADGEIYGGELEETEGKQEFKKYTWSDQNAPKGLDFPFWDKSLLQQLNGETDLKPTSKTIEFIFNNQIIKKISTKKDFLTEFAKAQVLCHNCLTQKKEKTQIIKFTGSSPDEIAILKGLRCIGYDFLGDFGDKRYVLGIDGIQRIYERIMSFEFTSERACSSDVFFDSEQGLYVLYLKGADSKVLNLCDSKLNLKEELAQIRNSQFANQGYRNLFFGFRYFSPEEFQPLLEQYQLMKNGVGMQEIEFQKLLEKDLALLGFVILNDELQDRVMPTIKKLKKAGIKVWMITGDKLETAINIGKSTGIIEDDVEVLRLSNDSDQDSNSFNQMIIKAEEKINNKLGFSIAIDTRNIDLSVIEQNDNIYKVFLYAKSIVCARTSPKLKGRITRLVKKSGLCVLAVGDGENDVNMISEADVGIGIFGKEGTQATQVSDFAVGEFKIIWKILLFYGRVNYMRTSNFVIIFLFKNFLFSFPQFFFGFYTNCTGQTIFDSWYMSIFNTLLSTFPHFHIGLNDIDIHYLFINRGQKNICNTPSNENDIMKLRKNSSHTYVRTFIKENYWILYHESQMNYFFSYSKFFVCLIYSFIMSFVIVILASLGFNFRTINGYLVGYPEYSFSLFTFLIIAINISFLIRSYTPDIITILFIIFTSILPFVIFVIIYDQIQDQWLYKTLGNILTNINFYLYLILLLTLYIIAEILMIVIFNEIESPFYMKLNLIENNSKKQLHMHNFVSIVISKREKDKKDKEKREITRNLLKNMFKNFGKKKKD